MSKTTPLSEVLKGAQKATFFASTDRVLAFDSNGAQMQLDPLALDVFITFGYSFKYFYYKRANTISLATWKNWLQKDSDNWSQKNVATDCNLFIVGSVSTEGAPIMMYNIITSINSSNIYVIPILLKTPTEWIWNTKTDVAAVLAAILPSTLEGGG